VKPRESRGAVLGHSSSVVKVDRMNTSIRVVSSTIALFAIMWGCNPTDARLAVEVANAPPPSLVAVEEAGADAEGGLISYCPSNECPFGYRTCKNSHFLCDVNLLTDNDNCGECGVTCPSTTYNGGHTLEVYSCVDGRCALACGAYSGFADCNGIADDGCETSLATNDNCGACGVQCADPSKPCVKDPAGLTYACGCPGGR